MHVSCYGVRVCIYGISIWVEKRVQHKNRKISLKRCERVYLHLECAARNTRREFDGNGRKKAQLSNERAAGISGSNLDDWPKCRKIVHMFCCIQWAHSLFFPKNLFVLGFVCCFSSLFSLCCFVGIFIVFFNLNYQNVLNALFFKVLSSVAGVAAFVATPHNHNQVV